MSPSATTGRLGWLPNSELTGPTPIRPLGLDTVSDPIAEASRARPGVRSGGPETIAGLPAGAPIPEDLRGEHAVVRVQSAVTQRWFVVSLEGRRPVELSTGSQHLVSATLGAP